MCVWIVACGVHRLPYGTAGWTPVCPKGPGWAPVCPLRRAGWAPVCADGFNIQNIINFQEFIITCPDRSYTDGLTPWELMAINVD